MKPLPYLRLLLAVAVAFVLVGAATALAGPVVVLLSGEKFPVLFKSTSGEGRLETTGKKVLTCSAEAATGEIESATSGSATDDLTGCKNGKVSCRSENAGGEKDAVETILVQKIKGVLISIMNAAKELEAGIANTLTEPLKVTCGIVKFEVRGSTTGLVSPINKEILTTEMASLVSKQKEGKQEAGTCVAEKATCEKLAKEPLEINIGGPFEGAGTELSGKVSFSKMLAIEA